MHNDIPSHSITGGGFGGGNGAEVHRGGRLVSSKTPKMDIMHVVWSGIHRGVHDGTPAPHAWD